MKSICQLLSALLAVSGLAACGGGSLGEAGTPLITPPVEAPRATLPPEIPNAVPVANAGINQNVVTGAAVTPDGSASSDANCVMR